MTAARKKSGQTARAKQARIKAITDAAITDGKDQLAREDITPAQARELALMGLVLAADRVIRIRSGAIA